MERTVRKYHHWEKWECFKAGFYETTFAGKTADECQKEYARFLSDLPRFQKALDRVLKEWPHSCDQFLSNENINRIAWLGQASMCIETGVPSHFKGGFNLLNEEEKRLANAMAASALQRWINEQAG